MSLPSPGFRWTDNEGRDCLLVERDDTEETGVALIDGEPTPVDGDLTPLEA